MVPKCTIGMDGPHVYNRDGYCVQYRWMVPICTVEMDGPHVYNWDACLGGREAGRERGREGGWDSKLVFYRNFSKSV